MFKALYTILGTGVILTYLTASWFGWEMASSGQRSVFGRMPFVGGYRGGK